MHLKRLSPLALVALIATAAHAGDAVWNKTAAGTSYDWNATANWLPNTTFPNGAGEKAGVTNDLAGAQTIRLRQDITIGRLDLGDVAASASSYAFTIGNSGTETYVLTLDSGVSGAPAVVQLASSGTPSHSLSVPVSLSSDLLIDLAGVDTSNRQGLSLKGNVDLNGRTLTFTNGIYNTQVLSIEATAGFAGTGLIVQNASSTCNVTGKKTFAGVLVANGRATGSNQSTFTFTGNETSSSGFTNAAELVINGYLIDSVSRMGGGVHSGSGTSFAYNPGQRLPRHRITMNGGHLMQHSQPATLGTANDWQKGLEWVRDDVSVLDFHSGYSYLGMTKASNTQGTELNIGTLLRGSGATAYLVGPHDPLRRFIAGNGGSHMLGSGGPAGSVTRSIIPWMTVFTSGGTGAIGGHGTFEDGVGFRCLETAEYSSSITAGPGANVKTAAIALTADTMINSLYYDSYANNNLGAGRTLTISSGGLILVRDRAFGQSGNAAAGTVSFGTAEGIVWVPNNSATILGAAATGSGGLTKAGTGWLQMTGANSLSGPVHVSAGTLQVGDGTYASNLGSGDVAVHNGAILRISCANAIADSAEVSLLSHGPYRGRVELDAGVNETVKYLELGGVGQPAGTYGSTSSSATFRDNRYFTGSGVLTVTHTAGATSWGTVVTVQ